MKTKLEIILIAAMLTFGVAHPTTGRIENRIVKASRATP